MPKLIKFRIGKRNKIAVSACKAKHLRPINPKHIS